MTKIQDGLAEREYIELREKALGEIAEIRAFIRKLNLYIYPQTEKGDRMRRGTGGKARLLSNYCLAKIREAGRRVPISDLFAAILDEGLDVGGRDEKSVLAGYLSRDPRINYKRDEGWGENEKGTAREPLTTGHS